MQAFKVLKNNKVLDYRVGQPLDLDDIRKELAKRFEVVELRNANRHAIGILKKDNQEYILKFSTTEGISVRTETEKLWNDEFNKHSNDPRFRVPKNMEDGTYNGLYFIIMEKFHGPLVCVLDQSSNAIEQNLGAIIDFSEYIQTLPINVPVNDVIQDADHKAWFRAKTKSWYDAVPSDKNAEIAPLWNLVEKGSENLEKRVRHGDFTPWHLIVLENGLGLIDGEHAHSHGVEYYDISYFIQRVHSVLELHELALKVFDELVKRGYDKKKLQTVLASRAIGGFLDESFKENSADYKDERSFMKWVLEL